MEELLSVTPPEKLDAFIIECVSKQDVHNDCINNTFLTRALNLAIHSNNIEFKKKVMVFVNLILLQKKDYDVIIIGDRKLKLWRQYRMLILSKLKPKFIWINNDINHQTTTGKNRPKQYKWRNAISAMIRPYGTNELYSACANGIYHLYSISDGREDLSLSCLNNFKTKHIYPHTPIGTIIALYYLHNTKQIAALESNATLLFVSPNDSVNSLFTLPIPREEELCLGGLGGGDGFSCVVVTKDQLCLYYTHQKECLFMETYRTQGKAANFIELLSVCSTTTIHSSRLFCFAWTVISTETNEQQLRWYSNASKSADIVCNCSDKRIVALAWQKESHTTSQLPPFFSIDNPETQPRRLMATWEDGTLMMWETYDMVSLSLVFQSNFWTDYTLFPFSSSNKFDNTSHHHNSAVVNLPAKAHCMVWWDTMIVITLTDGSIIFYNMCGDTYRCGSLARKIQGTRNKIYTYVDACAIGVFIGLHEKIYYLPWENLI